jgi:DNA-binding response OmpR family regulator
METGESEAGRSVMLVEDEPMIALMVEDMLEAMGFRLVGLFSRNAEALTFLCAHRPDVAVVDFSLADGKADPLARKLREQRIPFLIISGFTRSAADEAFDGAPWLEKPFSQDQFCSGLSVCLSEGAGSSAYM